MNNLAGKVAVVTGGGGGIGRGLARACAEAGMAVAIAEVDMSAARLVADELNAQGSRVIPIRCDVSDQESVQLLAAQVRDELGAAHLVCNNAGVVTFKYTQDMTEADWDWVLGVDLYGVIHGVQAFLPHMLERGEGHFVNTASIAGLVPAATPGIVAYTMAKFGVVGFSESLRRSVADKNIGVSVFCPGGVRSRIKEAGRNRPARFGGPEWSEMLDGPGLHQEMLEPNIVADAVLNGVRRNDLYVLTHPETRNAVELHMERLADACRLAHTAPSEHI